MMTITGEIRAGVEERVMAVIKDGARLTGAARDRLSEQLAKKYAKGASIRALAEQTGRSYGFVHRVLVESGVALRGRGGSHRARAARTSSV